jgi:hypothetical protein
MRKKDTICPTEGCRGNNTGAEMTRAKILTIAAALIMLGSHAGAPGLRAQEFETRSGGIFCPNYFALSEARAAAKAQDQRWYIRTGCFSAMGAMAVHLIDAGRNETTWRGRVVSPDRPDGVNVYFDRYDAQTTVLVNEEFATPAAAEKWAARNGVDKTPYAVIRPAGSGRIFYLLQLGPTAYPTLELACDRIANREIGAGVKSPGLKCQIPQLPY